MMKWADNYPPDEANYRKRVFMVSLIGICAVMGMIIAMFIARFANIETESAQMLTAVFWLACGILFVISTILVIIMQLQRWILKNPRLAELHARTKKETP